MTITTTLNRIREHSPGAESWAKLLRRLGKTQADDEPLPFSTIVAANGLEDALWCCRAEPQHAREWRLFAVWRARQVQHLLTDPRSLAAIDVAERFANGEATQDELSAARRTAVRIAAARIAAGTTAEAAWAATEAAWTAEEAAWTAAQGDAGNAAREAARGAARGAAGHARRAKFLEIVQ